MKKKNPNVWHAMDADSVCSALRADMHTGLSRKEAAARRRKCGQNAIWCVKRASAAHTARGEFLDLSAILLIITAAVSAVFQRGREALVLFVLLAVSASVRTLIFIAAQRMFENAAQENLPRATVIRNGRAILLPSDAVVPGDILVFSPGDPVTADVRLVSGDLTVSEAGVTNNRGAVNKTASTVMSEEISCETRSNILFAGSTVLGGSGRGVAFATGEDTYIFAKRGHITIPAGEDLSVLVSLSSWCRSISLLMIGVVLLITLGGLLAGHSTLTIDTLFLSALSLAVASMSEFLCVIAAIILAVSMHKLRSESDGSVVLRSADSMECFAKTQCLVVGDPHLFESGNIRLEAAFANGAWLDAKAIGVSEEAASICALALLCRYGTLHPVYTDGNPSADPLSLMLFRIFEDFDAETKSRLKLPSVTERKLTSKLHTILTSASGETFVYTSGNLSDVLTCCSEIVTCGSTRAITSEERNSLMEQARFFETQSFRTVAVARRVSPCTNLSKVSVLHAKMCLVGFLSIALPIDVTTKAALECCQENGIRVIVFTDGSEAERMLAVNAGVLAPNSVALHSAFEVSSYLERISAGDAAGNILVSVSNRRERARILRAVAERVENTAYIGSVLYDIQLFPSVPVAVAAERPFHRTPQCLLLASDASTGCQSEKKSLSAVEQTLRIVTSCKTAFAHMRLAAEYLLTVQIFRMTLMLSAAFLGLPMHAPAETLWWGLILDFTAVLMFAFSRSPLSSSGPMNREILFDKKTMLLHALFGVMAGVTQSVFTMYLSRIASGEVPHAVSYIIAILSSVFLALSMYFTHGQARIRHIRVNAAMLIYTALALITVVTVWRPVSIMAALAGVAVALMLSLARFLYWKCFFGARSNESNGEC